MINQTFTALRGYTQSQPATQPVTQPDKGRAEGARSGMAEALGSFAQTMSAQEATVLQGMAGGADPHALVQALAQTELAVETAVTLRNKVVEAYQEILRMPV